MGPQTKQNLLRLQGYWDWAKSDPSVAGFLPWHWHTIPNCCMVNPPRDQGWGAVHPARRLHTDDSVGRMHAALAFCCWLLGTLPPATAWPAVRSRHPATLSPAPPPPFCPPGPWRETGRIDAEHAACGLVADGVTDGSAALGRCAAMAVNCSAVVSFGPGRFLIQDTVVFSPANGTGAGVRLYGADDDSTMLCKCPHCTPSASCNNNVGPVLQVGSYGPHGGPLTVDIHLHGPE